MFGKFLQQVKIKEVIAHSSLSALLFESALFHILFQKMHKRT